MEERTDPQLHHPGAMPTAVDVVIIGGGLAGLTAGAVSARSGARTLVLDAHAGGGRAAVRRVPLDGGAGSGPEVGHREGTAAFNGGPRALYLGGAGRQVLRRLGITPTGSKPPTAGSAALMARRLDVLPTGAGSLLRSDIVARSSKPRLLACLLGIVTGRVPAGRPDQSAAEWIRTLARGHDDVAAVLGALVRVSTYAADLDVLAADAAVPHTVHAIAKGVLYQDDGFQQYVDALDAVGRGSGMTVVDHAPVVSLDQQADGMWSVECGDGRTVRTRAVVIAAGGPASAAGLLDIAELDATLGPPSTAACLELAVAGPVPNRFVLGIDEPLYLSEHSPPARLAPAGVSVLHVARYGATTATEDRPRLEALSAQAGIRDADVVARRFLAKMVVHTALPSVDGGGMAGRPAVAVAERPGAFLAGDWVGPVGLLADASFASGEVAGGMAAAHAVAQARAVRAGAPRPGRSATVATSVP